jgi:hypothetical protein
MARWSSLRCRRSTAAFNIQTVSLSPSSATSPDGDLCELEFLRGTEPVAPVKDGRPGHLQRHLDAMGANVVSEFSIFIGPHFRDEPDAAMQRESCRRCGFHGGQSSGYCGAIVVVASVRVTLSHLLEHPARRRTPGVLLPPPNR